MRTEYIARTGKRRKNKRLQKLNTMRRKKKTKMKRKNTKKVQRGGVCPCAVPLYTTVVPYAATVASAVGLYSLKKKSKKKPKK